MTAVGSLRVSTFSLPALTLVVGGARSGKSRFAESLAVGSGRPRRYVATAQAFDDEMRARIERHLLDRGDDWETIEAPFDLAPPLRECKPEFTVLIDCATLWLSNNLLMGNDLPQICAELLEHLRACPAPVIVVTNEVGQGIVPDNALARAFRDAQGRLNQQLAAEAGLVVTVIAGLPLVLKGQLPQGVA